MRPFSWFFEGPPRRSLREILVSSHDIFVHQQEQEVLHQGLTSISEPPFVAREDLLLFFEIFRRRRNVRKIPPILPTRKTGKWGRSRVERLKCCTTGTRCHQ